MKGLERCGRSYAVYMSRKLERSVYFGVRKPVRLDCEDDLPSV
jgi:hypothetical protein